MENKPTEPVFIRDPGSLFTRCVCPIDGLPLHVTGQGFWEDGWHRWQRQGRAFHQDSGWKLMREWARAK